jgi:hypothetical protein
MFEFKDLAPNPYPAWSTGATVAAQRLRSRRLDYGKEKLYFNLLKRADLLEFRL